MACTYCRCGDPAEFPLPSGGLCPCRCHAVGDVDAGMGAWLLGDMHHSLATSRQWAAVAYEQHGFEVVPLRNGAPIGHKRDEATKGADARRLWAVYPNSNVAVVVGERYVVLELAGAASRTRTRVAGGSDLNVSHTVAVDFVEHTPGAVPPGEVPPTTTACAPDGPRQLWFALEPGQRARTGELEPGVVAISRDDWVVVPPSIAPSGRRWRWTSVVGAAPAPTWLLETNEHGDH